MKEEEKIIEKAKVDSRYFAPLYNEYYEPIFRFVHRRVQDADVAADICSQTFLKAMLAIKDYEHRGYSISSWFYRIALNEIHMMYRSKKYKVEVRLNDASLSTLVDDEEFQDHQIDNNRLIIDGMNQLSAGNAELIEMRFFDKLSFREIGEVLKIAEDSAKMRVYRAVKKLRSLLGR